ncbi:MAG TPA: hypothetical protein EYN38_02170 [Flavobacteriales bacterium]|nr:hypothetical protein [Flavobacteriales bacterium]
MNKSVALPLLMAFSFLFGDNNVQVRLENGQKAQGEFIGTYMNHVHILMGNKIYYYACDDIISITSASEGFSYGKGYDYDCSKNTVTADILFPPELDPMTGEWTQMLPDVFNPDIPKPAVQKATPVVQKPAAKVEAGGVSAAEDFVVIDGVKYARVAPEKETAQAEPKAGVSVRAILPGQKSAIKSLSTAAGFTNSDLNTYLMQNYGQTLDGLSHKQGTNVINKFQAGSVSKPAQIRNNQATYNNAGSAPQFNVCHQAGLDAVASTSPLWYGGGVIYIIGVPAYFLSKPQPNHYAMLNIAPEEQLLYMECYKSAAQNERGKRMALGCGGYLLFAMMAVSM